MATTSATPKAKWARQQVAVVQKNALQRPEGQEGYNIWYHKYGGDKVCFRVFECFASFIHVVGACQSGWVREKATTRCDSKLDCGLTRCDKVSGGRRFFCLHFAKGCCANGANCTYFHRIPTPDDEREYHTHACSSLLSFMFSLSLLSVGYIGLTFDVFGREKHATDRDDMGGVGCFNRDCRSLYVGDIGKLLRVCEAKAKSNADKVCACVCVTE